MSRYWDNREAVNTDARLLVTSKPVLQETLKATAGAWQILSLKEELAGGRLPNAVSFAHLRERLGLSRGAEMVEVKRHWHRFDPSDAGTNAVLNSEVIYRKRRWLVVSCGKFSLILLSLEARK